MSESPPGLLSLQWTKKHVQSLKKCKSKASQVKGRQVTPQTAYKILIWRDGWLEKVLARVSRKAMQNPEKENNKMLKNGCTKGEISRSLYNA